MQYALCAVLLLVLPLAFILVLVLLFLVLLIVLLIVPVLLVWWRPCCWSAEEVITDACRGHDNLVSFITQRRLSLMGGNTPSHLFVSYVDV